MSPVSSRWSYNGWVCFDIPSFTSFVWYSLFLVQIGNSNEYVRLLVSVCEAFCHHRVCVVVCMKCVWADLPVHLQSLHHQKKGRSCYQMVKQTHHPTAHNSDPVSVRCQGFEGKQRDVLLLLSSPLLSPRSALLPSHYTLQGNENRMGKMEWNPSLCVFNCNQRAHLSMLAALCPRCVE